MFRQLSAIVSKEFAGYFRTPTAYILIGVYLVLSMFAAFYSSQFFAYDNSALSSFFAYQPEIFIVLMPAATMRLWADERRLGTIEFLLAKPVSYTVIVIGKFLAACFFGWMMLLLTLPFAFYAAHLVQPDILNIISAYIATALVVALITSAGCLVSAFNINAVLAYLFSVFFCWLLTSFDFNFLLAPVSGISDTISSRLSQLLNFYRHYQDMTMGQPGIDNLAYFIFFTLLMLWLNIAAIDYKKH
ncbi:MAG: ABC transporter permease [Alphaproteobacteria bacterium]|nr:ABC transporter permease [Alphaproteobacteria bacterium]